MAYTRLKKLTDTTYAPTNPANETDARNQVDGAIQEVYDMIKSITDGSSGADYVGSTAIQSGGSETVQGQLEELQANKVEANSLITAATKCKVTYDEKGLILAGTNLTAGDLPAEALTTDNLITVITGASRTDKAITEKAYNDKQIEIGAADMLQSTYDTQGKHTDAFNSANHTYDHTISGLTATNTKAAIDELKNYISTNTTSITTINTEIDTLQTTAWQDLGTVSVATNTLQINITVPDGINEIRIVGGFYTNSSNYVVARINGDTTLYNFNYGIFGSSYSGYMIDNTSGFYLHSTASDSTTENFADATFYNLASTTEYKTMKSFCNVKTGGAGSIIFGVKKTTAKVTAINLYCGSYIKSGTSFRVWGR